MEIADRTKERSTLVLAVLTLVVVGCTVLLSTRQAFRHQREAEEQHLFLTSQALYLSVESSVRRGPLREGEHRLSPRTADFFQALEQDGDVLFVGLVDDEGENLLTSPLHGQANFDLPDTMVNSMVAAGEWHGRLKLGNSVAYVYGKRMTPLRGMHMSLRDELGPPGFLVVGIDMDKYLSAYAGFRRNVLFQGLYILCAALLTWGFGWALLKRRDQAGKAAALERFQSKLLDHLPDGLITIDADNLVHSANPAALSILKLEAKDILGRPVSVLPAPLVARIADKKGAEAGWRPVSYGGARLEILSLPLAQDRDNAGMLIIRDRTTLRNLEKSLAESEKLAAVGALAAGVAHEVRNPLSSLRGFAQYFVKKLAGRAPEEEYAKTMVREADRLNRVITDLLFLGRPKAIHPEALDIDRLCRELLVLLRFDLEQKGVEVTLSLAAHQVHADAEALKQALLNLLLNSLDALSCADEHEFAAVKVEALPLLPGLERIPGLGGLRADEAEVDDPRQPDLPVPDQGRLTLASGRLPGAVYIEVRDLGRGMDAAQQAQAFEAFFTNKKHGTGLGLALVQRTMLDHGGAALISSAPGRGCTVRLVFPDARPGSGPDDETGPDAGPDAGPNAGPNAGPASASAKAGLEPGNAAKPVLPSLFTARAQTQQDPAGVAQ